MPLRRVYRVVLVLLSLPLIAGCRNGLDIEFIPEGGTYSTEAAIDSARDVEIGPVRELRADDASKARQQVLASLRKSDGAASDFADLMTETFDADTRSVPVYAEAATIDGRKAWLVVEAWGGRTGKLDQRRIWILERETGDVISSATSD